MKYYLWRGYLGNWPKIDISADEFNSIRSAKKNLLIVLGVEEKFDMLLRNYAEFEQSFFALTIEEITRPNSGWSEGQEARLLVTRRLSNLLTVCRQYLDQVQHDFGTIYGSGSPATLQVKTVFSKQYDQSFGYRLVEALRNYLQHRSSLIYSMEFPHENLGDPGSHRLRVRARAKIRVADFFEDPTFKKAIVQELRQRGDEFLDLAPLVRGYVEGLSRAHEVLRRQVQSDIDQWKESMTGVLRTYGNRVGDSDTRHVGVRSTHDDGRVAEEIQVFSDLVMHLCALRSRPVPSHLARCFVTNETV